VPIRSGEERGVGAARAVQRSGRGGGGLAPFHMWEDANLVGSVTETSPSRYIGVSALRRFGASLLLRISSPSGRIHFVA
jgi:hypothetical protein